MRANLWVFLLISGGAISCASLPEYARPIGEVRQSSDRRATDTIPYRQLTRADFLGTSPPERVAAHGDKLGALTCASMTPESRTLSPVVERDEASGDFVAHVAAMGYRGMMDRECSWWNPKSAGAPEAYVLEHEQIHFAIIELEARRLNLELTQVQGRGTSAQGAAEDLESAIREVVTKSVDRAVQRSRRFDDDTSLSHDPAQQSRWAEQVRAQLGVSN